MGPHLRRSAAKDGGARRIRTDDILLAKQTLYQLSYGPGWRFRPVDRARPARPHAEGFPDKPVKERSASIFKNLLYVIDRYYRQFHSFAKIARL